MNVRVGSVLVVGLLLLPAACSSGQTTACADVGLRGPAGASPKLALAAFLANGRGDPKAWTLAQQSATGATYHATKSDKTRLNVIDLALRGGTSSAVGGCVAPPLPSQGARGVD